MAPLRGRSQESAAFSALVSGLADGAGGITVLTGAPGIGKTRLLDEAARMAADQGIQVARGAADELDRVSPWGPLLQALRPAVLGEEELSSVRTLIDQRGAVIDVLGAAIERATGSRPLLIVLDDLQWTDQATLFALGSLPARLFSYPVGWLLAMRPVSVSPQLDSVVARLSDAGAGFLRLAPLSPAAITQMAGDLAGDRAQADLIARAEGNPLYLTELLREAERGTRAGHMASGTLNSAIAAHLRALPTDAVELLKVASVLGREFSVTELSVMTGRSSSELLAPLEHALRAEMVAEHGSMLMFRHDVIREAAYDQLPTAARHALHADAAAALRSAGAPLSRIAAQYAAGAQQGDEEAIGTLAAAAGELFATSPDAAADLVVRALDLLGKDDPRREDLTIASLRMLGWAGRLDEATALGRQFLDSRPVTSPATQAAILAAIRLAWRYYTVRPYPEPVPVGLIKDESVPLTVRASLLSLEQSAAMWAGDLDAARGALATARGWAAEAGDDREMAMVLPLTSHCDIVSGRLLDSLARDQAEAATARAKNWPVTAATCRHVTGEVLIRLGRLAAGAAELRQALIEAGQIGITVLIAMSQQRLAECLFGQGRLDDARAALETEEAAGRLLLAEALATRQALLAETLLRQGNLVRARQLAGTGTIDARVPPINSDLNWARALCLYATGKPAAALAELDPVYEQFSRGLLVFASVRADRVPALVSLARTAGAEDRAAQAADVAALMAARNPGEPLLAGLAAHARGTLDGDLVTLRGAVGLLETCEWPLATAAAREDLAGLLTVDDKQGAVTELGKAHAAYAEAGAERDVSRVRRALRALGVRRRHVAVTRPSHGWDSLTPGEAAVVEAVAEGLTNREAAAQLYLSPDTVNTHLRHAFAKLGIRSRVELVKLAHKQEMRLPLQNSVRDG